MAWWGRPVGRLWGSRDMVWTGVTEAGTVATLMVTATLEGTEATGCRSVAAEIAMVWDTEVVVVLESGLVVMVLDGAGACVDTGEGIAAVVLTDVMLLEEAPVPTGVTITGLSSDCWITFTPSGLLQADSRVLAL